MCYVVGICAIKKNEVGLGGGAEQEETVILYSMREASQIRWQFGRDLMEVKKRATVEGENGPGREEPVEWRLERSAQGWRYR